ncbi:MAG: GntR family transcriptional regulator [Vibrio sp.]|uniref:GntR family transcriptional regulator n=1 Tax=Vibrio sp. TaxID=678 RepID=UPI003A8800E9
MDKTNNVEMTRNNFDKWLTETKLPAGSKLPSERELCEKLNTKRMTLRQVLIELEVESKIFRKNRSGWFITPPRFIYDPKSLSSFSAEAVKQGRKPSWEYLNFYLCKASDCSFIPSGWEQENIQVITGWGGLDEHKVFYHETYIDTTVAPNFIKKIGKQAFSKVWEKEYGEVLLTNKLCFKPVNMPEKACKELGVAPNSFGILVEKHRATKDKRVVQIDMEYWRFESVELSIENL